MKAFTKKIVLENGREFYGYGFGADRVFSMQYHPESASGPQDSAYLFKKFTKIMEDHKNA